MAGKGKFGWIEGLFSDLGYAERGRRLAAAAETNPGLADAIQAAADSGDRRALYRILGDNIGATDAPRPRREPSFLPEEPVGPTPRADDLGNVRRMVGDELGPVGDMPEPFVRDAHAALDGTMGGEDLVGRLGASGPRPQYSIDLPNNTRAVTQADTGTLGEFSVADIFPGAPAGTPPRGFEVPFPEPRGLIPFGTRGPGEVVGGPTGSGALLPESRALSTQVTPRTALSGPTPRRIETTAPGPVVRRLESPEAVAERRAMQQLADAVDADAARRGTAPDGDFRFEPSQRRGGGGNRGGGGGGNRGGGGGAAGAPAGGGGWKKAALAAAAAAGGGIAAWRLGPDFMFDPLSLGRGRTAGESTADLAAEQNPPPAVMTQEPAPIRPAAPVDYSAMARDKIRQANEIQRREGRVTPESAALAREADALYRRSAEERAAGRGQPIMPSAQADDQTSAVRAEGRRQMAQNPGSDPRSQARHLLGRINAGEFGNGPQRQQAVNEVNRLFAMADAQRYGR